MNVCPYRQDGYSDISEKDCNIAWIFCDSKPKHVLNIHSGINQRLL